MLPMKNRIPIPATICIKRDSLGLYRSCVGWLMMNNAVWNESSGYQSAEFEIVITLSYARQVIGTGTPRETVLSIGFRIGRISESAIVHELNIKYGCILEREAGGALKSMYDENVVVSPLSTYGRTPYRTSDSFGNE